MGETIQFGLGFVTGRPNVCKVINNTYEQLVNQFKDLDDKVELTAFVLFDLGSKGGSFDENNIRLLCEECNKKRSNNFEKEMLVNSFLDHVRNNIEYQLIRLIIYY